MKWLAFLTGLLAICSLGLEAQRRQTGSTNVWKMLSGKYDKNKDGRITADEYPREESKFNAYDRNGDGALTAEDFSGGRSRPGRGGGGRSGRNRSRQIGGMVAVAADLDKSGDVTVEEWKAFLTSVSVKEKQGCVDTCALTAAVNRGASDGAARWRTKWVARALDKDGDGFIKTADMNKLYDRLDRNKDGALQKSELPARRTSRSRPARTRLPQPGEPAPDFDLPYVKKNQGTVRLSSFAGKKPVALLFGSYT